MTSAVETYTVRLTPDAADELRTLLPEGTPLKRKRGRIHRENLDYVKTVARMLHGLAKRAGSDIDMLPLLRRMQEDLDDALHAAIVGCRDEGYSWGDIGKRLGVSRQSAHQWFRRSELRQAVERQRDADTESGGHLELVR